MRAWSWLGLVLGACNAAPDARPPESHGSIAHVTRSGPLSGTSATVTIPTTSADALVVVITRADEVGLSRDVYAGDVGLDSIFGPNAGDCADHAEVWATGTGFGDLQAGASSVEVTMSAPGTFSIDVIELGGVTTPDVFDDNLLEGMPPGSANALDAEAGDVVLSTLTACAAPTGMAPANPFTSLVLDDNGTSIAADVPTVDGAYGAAWSYTGAEWSPTTMVFH